MLYFYICYQFVVFILHYYYHLFLFNGVAVLVEILRGRWMTDRDGYKLAIIGACPGLLIDMMLDLPLIC